MESNFCLDEINETVSQQLRDSNASSVSALTPDQQSAFESCLSVWRWLAKHQNSKPARIIESQHDGTPFCETRFVVPFGHGFFSLEDCRFVSVRELQAFFRFFKSEVLYDLTTRLESAGVLSKSYVVQTDDGVQSVWFVPTYFTSYSQSPNVLEVLTDKLLQVLTKVSANGSDFVPLRVLQNCTVNRGGYSWRVSAGEIIEDYQMCQDLLRSNAPVCRVDENKVSCPRCTKIFDANSGEIVNPPPLKIVQDFQCLFNGAPISRRKNDLEVDPFLCRFLVERNFPVVPANSDEYAKCVDCGNVFARTVSSCQTIAQFKQLYSDPGLASAHSEGHGTVYTPPVQNSPIVDYLNKPLSEIKDFDQTLEKRFWEPGS